MSKKLFNGANTFFRENVYTNATCLEITTFYRDLSIKSRLTPVNYNQCMNINRYCLKFYALLIARTKYRSKMNKNKQCIFHYQTLGLGSSGFSFTKIVHNEAFFLLSF